MMRKDKVHGTEGQRKPIQALSIPVISCRAGQILGSTSAIGVDTLN